MAYYSSELNALYIHVPKAYGISIRRSLEKVGFKRICCKDIMNKKIGTYNVIRNHKFINENTFIFTFIRNPYNRFVSGCNYVNKRCSSIIEKFDKLQLYSFWHIHIPQTKHMIIKDEVDYSHFNFIGLCEKISQDWSLLNNILKKRGVKKDLPVLTHENKSQNKINRKLDEKTLKFVNKHFPDDMALWIYIFSNHGLTK